MNVQKISPFYRTSSPIGAAAQKLTQLQRRRRRRGRRGRRKRSERKRKRRSRWNRRKGGISLAYCRNFELKKHKIWYDVGSWGVMLGFKDP